MDSRVVSFYKLQDKCEELFSAGSFDEGMEKWKEACLDISQHVDRTRFLNLQSDFSKILQGQRLDDAASGVRGYMREGARPLFSRGAPRPGTRSNTTDDSARTKSQQQQFFNELDKLNRSSQAQLFGGFGNDSHNSSPLLEHPGFKRTASAPVSGILTTNERSDDRQLKPMQQRSYTAPAFTGGAPVEEDHERTSGWRHAARKVYTKWHHEEKSYTDEDDAQQT